MVSSLGSIAWAVPQATKSAPAKKKASAHATQKSAPLPALLVEVEAKYSKASTLVADFQQINSTAATGQQKKSGGRILVKKPGKLRWETHEPDRSVLVSDGKKTWFYTPPFDEGERGQVMERPSSGTQSKLAEALLSGAFSIVHDMRIEAMANPSEFALTPKKGTAGTVAHAKIVVDSEKKLIQKVVLEHQGGNSSEITLSHIELGQPLGDEVFAFTPPPNTDVVRE